MNRRVFSSLSLTSLLTIVHLIHSPVLFYMQASPRDCSFIPVQATSVTEYCRRIDHLYEDNISEIMDKRFSVSLYLILDDHRDDTI